MAIERKTRAKTDGPVGAGTPPTPASALKRIPLPPLPHFRTRSTESAGSGAELAPAAASPKALAAPVPATKVSVAEGPVSHLEESELMGVSEPMDAEVREAIDAPAEPEATERTGATGASVMNDLVDEIEKGLEKELTRMPAEGAGQAYRVVVTCAGGLGAGRAGAGQKTTALPPPSEGSERRTGE